MTNVEIRKKPEARNSQAARAAADMMFPQKFEQNENRDSSIGDRFELRISDFFRLSDFGLRIFVYPLPRFLREK
jgi:hypothetical protein